MELLPHRVVAVRYFVNGAHGVGLTRSLRPVVDDLGPFVEGVPVDLPIGSSFVQRSSVACALQVLHYGQPSFGGETSFEGIVAEERRVLVDVEAALVAVLVVVASEIVPDGQLAGAGFVIRLDTVSRRRVDVTVMLLLQDEFRFQLEFRF